MRWRSQLADGSAEADEIEAPPLLRLSSSLVRSVRTPGFEGITFHEVLARTALNHVPASSRILPGAWTVNPYRGCSHACFYCYARSTHRYLDLDAGTDFDSQIVVKVNVAEVLARELATRREPPGQVALGTNTDPYQRAEGRYALMPGIIAALAERGVPFSILTKGTLLRRDLPRLAEASRTCGVTLALSIAVFDDALQQSLEPGTPSTAARLATVRLVRDHGLDCAVFLAPVLPGLTDSTEHLDRALDLIAGAGATSVFHTPLRLGPEVKEWFRGWLGREHPELVDRYQQLYGRGSTVPDGYRRQLAARMTVLLRRHGLLDASDRSSQDGRTTAAGFGFRPDVRSPPHPHSPGAASGAVGEGQPALF